jgi:hypothetical protein
MPNATLPLSAWRSIAAAAAAGSLACFASVAVAADAAVKITSVTVSVAEFSDNFAWATNQSQSFSLSALQAGGLGGAQADSYSADDWQQGLNRLAQTANARATGNTVAFTDVTTQLQTPGFNVGAMATPFGGSTSQAQNYASSAATHSGWFSLLDGTGMATTGTLTFDVYYTLSAAGNSLGYGQANVSLLLGTDSSGTSSFTDGILSSDFGTGMGSLDGHFSMTLNVSPTEVAYFTLGGNAIAAAVPEPTAPALFGLGLAALVPFARRRLAARG